MTKKILLTLIIGIFILSLAAAAVSDLGDFKRFECVNLPQTCPDCTYNNITRITTDSKSTIVLGEVVMTRDDTYYNYSFCNTTVLGEYIVNGFGDEGGVKDTWEYKFHITETGKEEVSVLNNPVIIILMSLALVFLFIGIKTGTIWFGFMSAIMFVLGGVYTTIYGFNDITNMYTQGIGIALIGVGITIMFISVYEGFLDED